MSKKYIYLIVSIFFFFALIGFFIPAPEIISSAIMKFLSELLKKTSGMSFGSLIYFIFLNNLQSSFMGIFLGVGLGLFPIFVAVVNGYVLGFISLISVKSGGVLSLWKLFPHGIFELPAIFLALGLGLKFGTFLFQRKKIKAFKGYFLNSLRVFLLIILPLLVLAAIIEGSLILLLS